MAGLYAYERQIMALWDDGLARADIAVRLGLKRSTVDSVVGMFDVEDLPADDRALKSAMRFASGNLLRAIERELGRRERGA